MNRRKFLKVTGLSAVAALFAPLVPKLEPVGFRPFDGDKATRSFQWAEEKFDFDWQTGLALQFEHNGQTYRHAARCLTSEFESMRPTMVKMLHSWAYRVLSHA